MLPPLWFYVLAGLCFTQGGYIDKLAAFTTFGEHNHAVDEGVDCVVFAEAHVETRMVDGATLALDDIAGLALLATEDFHTESLAF